MGWKQDMEQQVNALSRRLEWAIQNGEHHLSGIRNDVAKLTSRLSALEAKAGQCSCGNPLRVEITTEPQPGDRIKLRDVPVGRWCDVDGLPERVVRQHEHTDVRWHGGHTFVRDPNTPATLLPEDYEPGRKAESKPLRSLDVGDRFVRCHMPHRAQRVVWVSSDNRRHMKIIDEQSGSLSEVLSPYETVEVIE